jgi:antitoxin YefM
MTSIGTNEAQGKLDELLRETTESHEPIQITGKGSTGILVSQEDWRSIQETLYLVSIPGMRDSIRNGLAEPPENTSREPGW